MPREIKTTIAVDGEAAFKRSINEANTSIRNLGTQLTLAQAQFKKDGDAMKLMESRSKTLKDEIGQQEEIVKALEKAVKDSSDAYGENSDKTEKWEAELNRAKARLVNLQSELTLNNAGLDRNGKAFDDSSEKAADYQATLQTIGKNVSFQNITEGISGITGKIESAIKKVFSFAKAIRETFADAGEWADTLMTDATKYDMDVETLQKWQNAADFIDTDVSTIINARDKLGKKMKEGWTQGSGNDKIDMWEMLGIDLKDAETGAWRDKMDVMWDLGETLMSMAKIDGDDVRADAYAMEVFGKSWRELLPLFTAGRDEWEKTVAEQQVVSEERVKALGELDDANQALENSWDVTKYSFLAELAPTVTEVTEAVTEMLQAFNEWMDTDEGKKAMEDLSAAMTELFSGLKDVSFKDAIDVVSSAINGIKDALTWLAEHKNDVYDALKVIAGGFALLKVTELAASIGRIVSGLQGLGLAGGSKGKGGTPTTTPTTTGGDAGTGAATGAAGGGLFTMIKNAINGATSKAGSWLGSGGLWNGSFVADWFTHNTQAGRNINPEYGGSFSLQNLWDGIWEDVNEKIETELKNQELYGKETWSILDPESKKSYDAYQAQKQQDAEARAYYAETHGDQTSKMPAWAQEFESPEELAAYMATRATTAQKREMEQFMRDNPVPTQEEMNRELINSRATWNAAPEAPQAQKSAENMTPEEILRSVGGELNESQKAAAEAWWDEFRMDPMSDEGDEKWDALEATFGDNAALLERLSDAIDGWLTTGEESAPSAARLHDLSDGFAFVGFRPLP